MARDGCDRRLLRFSRPQWMAIGLCCGVMLGQGSPVLAQTHPHHSPSGPAAPGEPSVNPASTPSAPPTSDPAGNHDLVIRTLQELPQPPNTNPQATSLTFAPGAYGQQLLNVETIGAVEEIVAFYRASLTKLGYQERLANASVDATGFSLVFEIPPSLELIPSQTTPTPIFQVDDQLTVYGAQPAVRLVVQGLMTEPGQITMAIRFQES